MGSFRHGPPVELARRLSEGLSLGSAVETGTRLGNGAVDLRSVFPRVWSIELSYEFFAAARKSRHTEGLTFVHGSSLDKLPEVIEEIGAPALFWLDAHYSGEGTAGVEYECPLLGEISAVDVTPQAGESVLLIDDARFFLVPPPDPFRPDQWPTLTEVIDRLRARHDRYVTLYEDVIIAVPPAARPIVETYCLERSYPHRSRARVAAGYVKYQLDRVFATQRS